ncbi:MAG TPA: PQQ-binding-like beta-propeller repeat protein [Vicinamibacterales bacterium]|nr:PQQ-binding-like beta-propeller repeat protein [Vicinamibacterales bacterium]
MTRKPARRLEGDMRGVWLWLTVVAAVLSGGGAAAEDWPRFRGPNGSGVSNSAAVPAEFGPSKNLVWKTPVPFGRSSPVLAGDRIFLTAAEGNTLITLCLDRASGRVIWRKEITRSRVTPVYKLNDAASPTPVTDGANVFVFFPDVGLIAFGPDGAERWRLPLGPFDTFYGLGASPILAGDTLLLVCDARTGAFLIAVDTASGRVRWRAERRETSFEGHASPVVSERKGETPQVIVLGVNRIDAYDVATGERKWWLNGLAFLPVASPVLGPDVVIVSTWGSDAPVGPSFEEFLKTDANKDRRLTPEETGGWDEFGAVDTNRDGIIVEAEWNALRQAGVGDYGMVAVGLRGARGDLTETGIIWRDRKNHSTIPTPVVYKSVLYVIKNGGIIASLDPGTGEIFKVGRTKEALGDYYASPVAADGKVIFLSDSGKATVLKADRQWEILAVNDIGEESYATPAIADGKIFLRTRNALYCFGAR